MRRATLPRASASSAAIRSSRSPSLTTAAGTGAPASRLVRLRCVGGWVASTLCPRRAPTRRRRSYSYGEGGVVGLASQGDGDRVRGQEPVHEPHGRFGGRGAGGLAIGQVLRTLGGPQRQMVQQRQHAADEQSRHDVQHVDDHVEGGRPRGPVRRRGLPRALPRRAAAVHGASRRVPPAGRRRPAPARPGNGDPADGGRLGRRRRGVRQGRRRDRHLAARRAARRAARTRRGTRHAVPHDPRGPAGPLRRPARARTVRRRGDRRLSVSRRSLAAPAPLPRRSFAGRCWSGSSRTARFGAWWRGTRGTRRRSSAGAAAGRAP